MSPTDFQNTVFASNDCSRSLIIMNYGSTLGGKRLEAHQNIRIDNSSKSKWKKENIILFPFSWIYRRKLDYMIPNKASQGWDRAFHQVNFPLCHYQILILLNSDYSSKPESEVHRLSFCKGLLKTKGSQLTNLIFLNRF